MPLLGSVASTFKLVAGSAWSLVTSSYIGNNYSANYGVSSSANVDGSGTVRWHRVNPQSSTSGFHNIWNGSSWVARTIYPTSPGREIFGYGGSPNSSGTSIIAGGQSTGSNTALSDQYNYSVTGNSWSAASSLPGGRRYLGHLPTGGFTTTVYNFAIGGVGSSNGSSTTVHNNTWRYDNSSWTTRATHPLNYEWSPYSPHTRGVEGNVSTYRIHTIGGYTAPGGTYATETQTLGHYGYQNSSDTWTTYTSFPGGNPGGTSTAANQAGTADRIYVWDWSPTTNLYTWDGSSWSLRNITFQPPSGASVTSNQVGSFIDSTQKVTFNTNFVGLYQVNKVS